MKLHPSHYCGFMLGLLIGAACISIGIHSAPQTPVFYATGLDTAH